MTSEFVSDLNMAAREHRKALPSNRPERKPGEPWDPEVWEAFKEEALQNGARVYWEGKSREHLRFLDDDDFYEHRVDGPAIIYIDGSEYWFTHGRRHREDGPAIIRSLIRTKPVSQVSAEYWLYGMRYTDETFEEKYK